MERRTVPMKELAEVVKLQLNSGGRSTLAVTGNSMRPMLASGRDSVILILPGNEKKGDVVLYQRENGQYVLHRIIDVTEDGYIISGDNQAMREPVKKQQLVAVMEGFIRKGKTYSKDAKIYRLYQTMWVELFFLRWLYITAGRLRAGLRRRIRKIIHKQ